MNKRKPTTPVTRAEEPNRIPCIVERLSSEEASTLLRLLLDRHPQLRSEAEQIATELVSSPSAEDIAEEVLDALTSVDLDALNGRAGKHSWGYVEPGEAAVELLGESLEELIADMKRRVNLGLISAGIGLCAGLVEGLCRARNTESEDGALSWAPDFPLEEADYAVRELLRACPRQIRRATADRLREVLTKHTPEWTDVLGKTLDDCVRR